MGQGLVRLATQLILPRPRQLPLARHSAAPLRHLPLRLLPGSLLLWSALLLVTEGSLSAPRGPPHPVGQGRPLPVLWLYRMDLLPSM